MQTFTALAFWALATVALIAGWIGNSKPEQMLVVAIGIALIATMLTSTALPPDAAYAAVLAIDCCLALFAIGVALASPTYWPIWFAAFALVGALTGLAASFVDAKYWLFRSLAGFWAAPALLSVIVGTLRDGRAQLQST